MDSDLPMGEGSGRPGDLEDVFQELGLDNPDGVGDIDLDPSLLEPGFAYDGPTGLTPVLKGDTPQLAPPSPAQSNRPESSPQGASRGSLSVASSRVEGDAGKGAASLFPGGPDAAVAKGAMGNAKAVSGARPAAGRGGGGAVKGAEASSFASSRDVDARSSAAAAGSSAAAIAGSGEGGDAAGSAAAGGGGGGGGSSQPTPFVAKAFAIVEDSTLDRLVSWCQEAGREDCFVVWDPVELARDVLPLHFKHNNFTSFVRQLHTYGFRKVDSERWCFRHPLFKPGRADLLKDIRRRRKQKDEGGAKTAAGASVSHGRSGEAIETGSFGGNEQFEQLRRDKDVLVNELVRMRQMQNHILLEMQEQRRRQAATENQVSSLVQNVGQMMGFLDQCFSNHPQLPDNLRKRQRTNLPAGISYNAVPQITWDSSLGGGSPGDGTSSALTAASASASSAAGAGTGAGTGAGVGSRHGSDAVMTDLSGRALTAVPDGALREGAAAGASVPGASYTARSPRVTHPPETDSPPDSRPLDIEASLRQTKDWSEFLGGLTNPSSAAPPAAAAAAAAVAAGSGAVGAPKSSVTIQHHNDFDNSPDKSSRDNPSNLN